MAVEILGGALSWRRWGDCECAFEAPPCGPPLEKQCWPKDIHYRILVKRFSTDFDSWEQREETFSINEVVAFQSSARVKVDNLFMPKLTSAMRDPFDFDTFQNCER